MVISYGVTRSGFEPRPPAPRTDALTTMLRGGFVRSVVESNISSSKAHLHLHTQPNPTWEVQNWLNFKPVPPAPSPSPDCGFSSFAKVSAWPTWTKCMRNWFCTRAIGSFRLWPNSTHYFTAAYVFKRWQMVEVHISVPHVFTFVTPGVLCPTS